MGPRHQSLNVMKLAAGAEKISGMLVLRGEAPGRNFRGTGTQRGGGGSEDLSTTKIQGARGMRGERGGGGGRSRS